MIQGWLCIKDTETVLLAEKEGWVVSHEGLLAHDGDHGRVCVGLEAGSDNHCPMCNALVPMEVEIALENVKPLEGLDVRRVRLV